LACLSGCVIAFEAVFGLPDERLTLRRVGRQPVRDQLAETP
jgi:hypothetical protein